MAISYTQPQTSPSKQQDLRPNKINVSGAELSQADTEDNDNDNVP